MLGRLRHVAAALALPRRAMVSALAVILAGAPIVIDAMVLAEEFSAAGAQAGCRAGSAAARRAADPLSASSASHR